MPLSLLAMANNGGSDRVERCFSVVFLVLFTCCLIQFSGKKKSCKGILSPQTGLVDLYG